MGCEVVNTLMDNVGKPLAWIFVKSRRCYEYYSYIVLTSSSMDILKSFWDGHIYYNTLGDECAYLRLN